MSRRKLFESSEPAAQALGIGQTLALVPVLSDPKDLYSLLMAAPPAPPAAWPAASNPSDTALAASAALAKASSPSVSTPVIAALRASQAVIGRETASDSMPAASP